MKRRGALAAAAGWAAALCSVAADAAAPARQLGEMKPLGQDRYQIGRIVVDKPARSFTVPGRVNVLGKPLEYLATTPGGMKAYETLLELDTFGSEFNLACILIGLERDARQANWRQHSPSPLAGQRLKLSLAWMDAGKRRQVPAAVALLNPEADVKPESVEWVYTGAPVSEDIGRFAADDTGTLISFIRDANSIIESAVPLGVGAYGSIRGHAMLPPVGSAIDLTVEAVASAK